LQTKGTSLWNSWSIYIFNSSNWKCFPCWLRNLLTCMGESWKCIKNFEQLLHICDHLKLVRGRNAVQNNIKSWKLKVDETIQHFPCNKTNLTKGLDHGLTTNHFKDTDNCDDKSTHVQWENKVETIARIIPLGLEMFLKCLS